jgi:hypothetical protein
MGKMVMSGFNDLLMTSLQREIEKMATDSAGKREKQPVSIETGMDPPEQETAAPKEEIVAKAKPSSMQDRVKTSAYNLMGQRLNTIGTNLNNTMKEKLRKK